MIKRDQQGDAHDETGQLVDPNGHMGPTGAAPEMSAFIARWLLEVRELGTGWSAVSRDEWDCVPSGRIHDDGSGHLLVGVAPTVTHVRRGFALGRKEPELMRAEGVPLPSR